MFSADAFASELVSKDGFFGSIIGGVQSGLSRVGSDVLPVWVADKLKLDAASAKPQTTFNPLRSLPRIDDGMLTTSTPRPVGGNTVPADWSFVDTGTKVSGGLNVDGSAVLVAALGVGLLILMLRR